MILAPGRWKPEIHQGLEAMLQEAPAGAIATFDWDDTCIDGDIGETLLERIDARDGGDRFERYQALALTDKPAAWVACAAALAGMTHQDAHRTAAGVLDDALRSGVIKPVPEMQELITAMQDRGWEVWVVSGSIEHAIIAAAAIYGISAERVIAQRLQTDASGVLVAQSLGPILYMEGKNDAIALRMQGTATFAAGDAGSDLRMLQAASHRLVIGDHPELLAAAGPGGWWHQPAWST